MVRAAFRIKPLTPVIGAEIEGIDLEQPVADEAFTLIHDALIQHQVIFFRDQDISVEAQMNIGRRFGALVAHPNDPGLQGHREVMIIHADESSKRVAGESWHSDVSCDQEPPLGSILRIHTLPETGGDTLFASMYAAYDALSEPMKAFLGGLAAVHDGAPYYRSVNQRIGRDDGGRSYPRAEHPVIRTHPVSGRRAIFVNKMFTTHIVGIPKAESDAILAFLFGHVQQAQLQCRFRWQKDSIAFWDNRCVQHQAIWDYWPRTRSGYRVTIKGDRPV
jgi:alpha-ketoglutarate-dependent taurine dioxygenase